MMVEKYCLVRRTLLECWGMVVQFADHRGPALHHPRRSTVTAPAPLVPRSGAPAATLRGGLRPGSLRVHAPCKSHGHGARLGFPGRRSPGGPAAPAHVARGLQGLGPKRGPMMIDLRVAAASARPPAGEMRHRQPVPHLMIDWCVSSPRTDGHAADRTR